MILRVLIVAAVICALPGCKTQGIMTAEATGCRTLGVDIVKSRYSRSGSTTAWCARCESKLFHCVSNPGRKRVVCREAAPEICE